MLTAARVALLGATGAERDQVAELVAATVVAFPTLPELVADGQELDVVSLLVDDRSMLEAAIGHVRAHPPLRALIVVGGDASEHFPDAAQLPYDVWIEPDRRQAVAVFGPVLRSIREREALEAVDANRRMYMALSEILHEEAQLGDAIAAAMGVLADGLQCSAASFWRPSALSTTLIRVGCTGPNAALDAVALGVPAILDDGCDRVLELPVQGTPAGAVLLGGQPHFPGEDDDTGMILPATSNGQVCGVIVLSGAEAVARRRTTFELALSAADRIAAFVQWHLAEQRFLAVTAASDSAIVLLDARGSVVSYNAAAERLFGRASADALERPFTDLTLERWSERHRTLIAALADDDMSQTVSFGCLLEPASASPRRVEISVSVWGTGADRRTAWTIRDVEDRHRAQEHIAELAYRDRISGLPNRQALAERISALADTYYGLVALGVRRYEVIADTLGTSGTDALLNTVGSRLSALDVEAFHLGGDCFVLLVDTGASGAVDALARTADAALSAAVSVPGGMLRLSVAVGIADVPGDGALHPSTEIIDRCLRALAEARDADDDAPRRFSALPSERDGRLRREMALERAIRTDQLRLHYQPIIDLATGEVESVEALVRWQHPTEGLIGPGRFVPDAEESGLIVAMGNWVIDQVCQQLERWRHACPGLRVSLNVSPRQLLVADLTEHVAAALVRHAVDPRLLTAEVVESAALRDINAARRVLERLRDLGLRVALDDFGVGESSLGRLADLTVDTLKIDRSFVAGLPNDAASRALTASAIGLAHGLALSQVAEGVETPEQLLWLTEHRCSHAQGYLLSRPVPAEDIPALVRSRLRSEAPTVA